MTRNDLRSKAIWIEGIEYDTKTIETQGIGFVGRKFIVTVPGGKYYFRVVTFWRNDDFDIGLQRLYSALEIDRDWLLAMKERGYAHNGYYVLVKSLEEAIAVMAESF